MSTYLNNKFNNLTKKDNGFTLLEVLIAIVITALIGLGTSQLLSGTIKAQSITQKNSERFEQIQRTILLLSRDIQQINTRAIRDEYGDFQPALTNSNALYLFELTRSGWRNPMDNDRSESQRVAYELVDGELLRHYWKVLDRAQDTESVFQSLLKGVDKMSLRFMDSNFKWVDSWPPAQSPSAVNPRQRNHELPIALEITVVHDHFGTLTRLYDLPQYVTNASSTGTGTGTGTGSSQGTNTGGSSSNKNNEGNE